MSDEEQLRRCYRLRHAYFVQERGWVSASEETPGLETDRYDPHALHLAVWQGDEAVAYLRMLPFVPHVGFMIDRDLKALLSDEERQTLPRASAVEISRLVCRAGQNSEDGQGNVGEPHAMELLFKQLYEVV